MFLTRTHCATRANVDGTTPEVGTDRRERTIDRAYVYIAHCPKADVSTHQEIRKDLNGPRRYVCGGVDLVNLYSDEKGASKQMANIMYVAVQSRHLFHAT